MPTPRKKPNIAHRARLLPCLTLLKPILLHITHCLQPKRQYEDHYTHDIRRLPERRLRVLQHSRRIQNRNGEGYNPNPQHLEDPETEEGKEPVALVVEAVIFACLQNPEEEET